MWRDTVDENENSYGEDYNDGLEVLLRASRQISSCKEIFICSRVSPAQFLLVDYCRHSTKHNFHWIIQQCFAIVRR